MYILILISNPTHLIFGIFKPNFRYSNIVLIYFSRSRVHAHISSSVNVGCLPVAAVASSQSIVFFQPNKTKTTKNHWAATQISHKMATLAHKLVLPQFAGYVCT